MIKIDEVARRLANPRPGGAILFTGAGFSVGARNGQGKEIPLAKDFANSLADEIGEQSGISLSLISEIYNERAGDASALVRRLQETFSCATVTDSQRQALRYPWKRIYTTNYDDVAEKCDPADGLRSESYSRDRVPFQFERKARQIVHLNGFIGDIDSDSAVDDFALTLTSYFDRSLYSSRWASTLRFDFSLSDLIVFVGYSMADTAIENIVGANPDIRAKTVVIQREDLSANEERYLARFGTVHKVGTDGLAAIISSSMIGGLPTVSVAGPENFREVLLPEHPSARTVSDINIDALLGRGVYDQALYFETALRGGRPYLVRREAAQTVVRLLSARGSEVVVHAEMGNGKSLLVEQAICEFLRGNFRVFVIDPVTDNQAFDVEYFSKIEQEYVLVIEELLSHQKAVETLKSQLKNARILSTARSSAFEVKIADIKHLFSAGLKVVDANRLHSSDIDDLIETLNSGAYWHKFQYATNKSAKRRVIEKDCRGELSSVLLGIVESQALDQRVRALFSNDVGKKAAARDIIVLALCLNFLEMRPTFELLSELMGVDVFSTMAAFDDQHLRQFFAIGGIEIIARSPILSGYLLRNVISDDQFIEVAVRALKASNDRYRRARRYREINSKLMTFSFIEKVIASKNNKYARVQEYYDRVGEVGYKSSSPYYWLQFAIAASAFHDYRSAERYFGEAMKIAERRFDFYTYKLENGYAKFLLESRRNVEIWSDFFESFMEASRLAMVQTSIKDAGNYPYMVVEKFADYLEVRAQKFSRKQGKEALAECKRWIDKIDSLSDQQRKNRFVQRARRSASTSYDLLSGN